MVLYFILAMLATYRVARMIALEDGPFDIFSRLQDHVDQKTWVGRGLRCVLCVSFWLALPAALLVGPADPRELLLLWGGIAGSVMIVHKVIA